MESLDINDVTLFVEDNIRSFHTRRLQSLEKLKLEKILRRKNPYLFKAKNISTPKDLVKGLLDAHLSSQEETLFGEFLEQLAIYVCGQVYSGRKSAAEGIDLEFEKDGVTYLVSVKSGPNWGNSSQIKRMVDNFRRAIRILKTNNPTATVIAVNGCCYGRDERPDKGDYRKLCGQRFWAFISGSANLYREIIEPLGHRAKEWNEEFSGAYAQIIGDFALEFENKFCRDGVIDWELLVEFNSGRSAERGDKTDKRRK